MLTQFPRRNFLSLAGKSIGLAALASPTVSALLKDVQAATRTIAHLSPEQAATDEDYWSTIQNAFSVTRGIINLNIQPKVSELDFSNAVGSPVPSFPR